MVAGVSVKIDMTYGGRTSIGCTTIKQCGKLKNIMGLFLWYKDGIKNYSSITSQ